MSERRLRELGTFDTEGGVERCAFCHVLVSAGEHYPQCPMDADPDVVRVLRDKLWPMVHVLGTGNAHWAKRVVAQEIIHWIERDFHIRLIGVHLSNGQLAEPEEVGWEWTKEE